MLSQTNRRVWSPDGTDLTSAIRETGTAKEIARVVGCSEKTAVRYRIGERLPDILSLAKLMRHSRTVADAVLRLAGLDDVSLDLNEARLRDELATLILARAEKAHARAEAAEALAELERKLVADRG